MPGAFDPTDTSGRAALTTAEVAERFVELFYNREDPLTAFSCWMHPDYIQHNPRAPDGRDATMEMMRTSKTRFPDISHEVKRVIVGDADLFAVHFQFRRDAETRGQAAVDILRVKDGWIVEHWDVMQDIPDPASVINPLGMF